MDYSFTQQSLSYASSRYLRLDGIRRELHRCRHEQVVTSPRFLYKKPKGVTHKLKPEEQQEIIECYKEVFKSNDAHVSFMDAVQPTQSTKLSYGGGGDH